MSHTWICMSDKSGNFQQIFQYTFRVILTLKTFFTYLFNNGVDIAHPASKSGNGNDLRS